MPGIAIKPDLFYNRVRELAPLDRAPVFEKVCGIGELQIACQRSDETIPEAQKRVGNLIDCAAVGRTVIDLVAELDNGTFLFGECKWRADTLTRLSDLSALQASVARLPEARWRSKPSYILFRAGWLLVRTSAARC